MSASHKRPLGVFCVLAVLAAVVMVGGLRQEVGRAFVAAVVPAPVIDAVSSDVELTDALQPRVEGVVTGVRAAGDLAATGVGVDAGPKAAPAVLPALLAQVVEPATPATPAVPDRATPTPRSTAHGDSTGPVKAKADRRDGVRGKAHGARQAPAHGRAGQAPQRERVHDWLAQRDWPRTVRGHQPRRFTPPGHLRHRGHQPPGHQRRGHQHRNLGTPGHWR